MNISNDKTSFQTIGEQIEDWQDAGFVGRAFELQLFEQYLLNLQSKRERIINIHGTGGMGKSQLLGQFRKAVQRHGFIHAAVNLRDYGNNPLSFCRQLTAQIEPSLRMTEALTEEQCINLINEKAARQIVVFLLDQYEEAGTIDSWLREQWLPRLSIGVLIIISGRYPLEGPWKHSTALQRLIVSLPVTELTYEDTAAYLNIHGIRDETIVDTVWMKTLGHPLSLSMLLPCAMKGILDFDEVQGGLHSIIHQWLQETDHDELRQLVMAASVPRTFQQELLSSLLGKELPYSLFEQLIRLSFVMRTARGWHLHDLVRECIRSMFQERMPDTFEQYRQALIEHYYLNIKQCITNREHTAWHISEVMPLTNNSVLRAHFRLSKPSVNSWEKMTHEHLTEVNDYIAQRKNQSKYIKMLCSDPVTGEMFRYTLSPKQSLYRLAGIEVKPLLDLGAELRLLRDPSGKMVGLHAALPIHKYSMHYLLQAPLSAAYFHQLPAKQQNEYWVEPQRSIGTFLFTTDVENLERDDLRSDIVRVLFEQILSGKVIVTSPPPLDYCTLAYRSLGFECLSDVVHFYYDGTTPAPYYVLDTRGQKLAGFIKQVIQYTDGNSDEIPHREIGVNFGFTPRELEVAKLLITGDSNAKIAAALYISEAAVKKHVQSMLTKTGLQNRTQLANLILSSNISMHQT
ncbi:helix-turn-helix transcriptional regulator [Paenibacillus turpanensis]|uniref:helix-turn-helix transcriptional regulator n=1 Tax=Paenibacillus turpanensis TaxID=2689078 RepID=UPI00140D7749|nr:LuxR family transcriptional regulator [Paenibacillus turpanensis]